MQEIKGQHLTWVGQNSIFAKYNKYYTFILSQDK